MVTGKSPAPSEGNLVRWLWIPVWLGLALYLLQTLWLGISGLSFPYQLDYGEGVVLWFSQQLAHGQPIYKGLTGFPYASSNYPPVGMLLAALLMPVLGEGYTAGRLLTLASGLVVAALIFRVVATKTFDRRAAAVAVLLFLWSPYIYHWIPLFRVDMVGLALAFAGLFAVWRFESQIERDKPASHLVVLAMAFFLLALYTKHVLFAAPAAAFLALARTDWRRALAFALGLGALGGALYLVIDLATQGGFTFGLVSSNATVFLVDQLAALLRDFALTFPVLIGLGLLSVAENVRTKRLSVLDYYMGTSLLALVMAGRTGAWENYFFEAIAATCVQVGIIVSRWLPKSKIAAANRASNKYLPFAVPLLLLVQLVLMQHDPRIAVDLLEQTLVSSRQLQPVLAGAQGTIISEDMGALVTSGKQVSYYTFQYSSLARSGQWDQNWELDNLRTGSFPLVILERGTRENVDHYRRFTREFVSALDHYYARTETLGKYELYTPSPLENVRSVEFGNSIAMVGWTSKLKPGTFDLTIVWEARQTIEQRYIAFVHLIDGQGNKVAQDDHEPRHGEYPTVRWARGEMVREQYTLALPATLAPGRYTSLVGWYDSETGERLAVTGTRDDAAMVTEVEIRNSQ